MSPKHLSFKRHNQIFKQAIRCAKRGLSLVAAAYSYLIVRPTQIDLGEYFASVELGKQLVNQRERIPISNRGRIQTVVINAEN